MGRFKVRHVVIAHNRHRDLMSLMQLQGQDELPTRVEKVVVDKSAKTFGIELARMLQRLAPDPKTCVVKQSSSNLHCANGPTFRLGNRIVQQLNLRPISTKSQRAAVKPATRRKRQADGNPTEDHDEDSSNTSYRRWKQMSADIFRYVTEADSSKLADMKLDIDE